MFTNKKGNLRILSPFHIFVPEFSSWQTRKHFLTSGCQRLHHEYDNIDGQDAYTTFVTGTADQTQTFFILTEKLSIWVQHVTL